MHFIKATSIFVFVDPLEQFELFSFGVPWDYYYFTSVVMINFLMLVLLTSQFRHNGYIAYVFRFLYRYLLVSYNSIFGASAPKYYFYPYFYIFSFLLLTNVIGLLPWSFTATSLVLTPFFFSFITIGATIFIGFETRGWKFFGLFSPSNAPRVILHFLIVLELLSYATRLISLSVRLFANMAAGHALLKILLSFAWALLFSGGLGSFLGTMGFILILAIMLLELFIAFLQAYVFVFLSMIYLSEVVS